MAAQKFKFKKEISAVETNILAFEELQKKKAIKKRIEIL